MYLHTTFFHQSTIEISLKVGCDKNYIPSWTRQALWWRNLKIASKLSYMDSYVYYKDIVFRDSVSPVSSVSLKIRDQSILNLVLIPTFIIKILFSEIPSPQGVKPDGLGVSIGQCSHAECAAPAQVASWSNIYPPDKESTLPVRGRIIICGILRESYLSLASVFGLGSFCLALELVRAHGVGRVLTPELSI